MAHQTVQPWLNVGLKTATNKAYNQKRSDLFEAAESGNWDEVFSILQHAQKAFHESWVNCPTSAAGWTLLHYAALENKPVPVVNRLLQMGAWRKFIHSYFFRMQCSL
jgi:hypothetical protein